jgi:murein DD-endopeptidase MepM/ murein hydrolase activator NlpD
MDKDKELSRRDFLKLSLAAGGALFIPKPRIPDEEENPPENLWPRLNLESLPDGEVKEVLLQIPNIRINTSGFLTSDRGRVPSAETNWSRQHRRPIAPDALVVHWNGDPNPPQEATVAGLLSGYNEERTSREWGYEYTTSAHATIGPYPLSQENSAGPTAHISILQTQAPQEGAPTVSSHLRSNLAHERQSYLDARHPINALTLVLPFYGISRAYNFLPNVLRGSGEDLNLRTISLELIGKDFDSPEGHPNPQLTANVVGVIFAYLNKYPDIKFANIMGHFEIQEDKADPGKKFMAEVRLLLALKVLSGQNEALKENLFGPFKTESGDLKEAVKRFFDFHWDWFVASYWGHQKKVFEWENQTGFWTIYKDLFPEGQPEVADRFILPAHAAVGREIKYGNRYGIPEYHEGLDINVQSGSRKINEDLGDPVYATANGKVVFTGEIPGRPGLGKTIVVEHILPQGGKALSLYAHLDQIGITKGQVVSIEEQIGAMGNSGGQGDSHLHFALMPASSKREKELSLYLQLSYGGVEVNPYLEDEVGRIYIVPATVSRQTVESYYFEPLSFIAENS